MRTAAMAAALIVFAVSCSSGAGDATPTPRPSATTEPTPVNAEPTDTEATLQPGDVWFQGTVTDVIDARPNDGPYIITVEASASLGGEPVVTGEVLTIVQNYGFSTNRCLGQLTEPVTPGVEVAVFAHPDHHGVADLATCDDERYYVRLAGTIAPTLEPTSS